MARDHRGDAIAVNLHAGHLGDLLRLAEALAPADHHELALHRHCEHVVTLGALEAAFHAHGGRADIDVLTGTHVHRDVGVLDEYLGPRGGLQGARQ